MLFFVPATAADVSPTNHEEAGAARCVQAFKYVVVTQDEAGKPTMKLPKIENLPVVLAPGSKARAEYDKIVERFGFAGDGATQPASAPPVHVPMAEDPPR